MGKDLDYEKEPGDTQDLYTASFQYDDGKNGYVAVIQNTEEAGNVQVFSNIQCRQDVENCEDVLSNEEERIYKWIKSIKFIDRRTAESEE
ncbi:hypothetical protein HXA31_14055 [Salipaludibacillus agaradhaerens]|uniref:Uncharacterized protein n=1 Tax=Salipaludibacillus agaradhaerens TaxID=76935 RepID=A0A9Q4FXQ6_SALAG|nr:hypothetical protein [Salipaludibacillus agaradhaerens]MCR6094954.1 hypothetical protein [Salipaludibacillus agaradhaerens]MCR6115488.1 hypothetical protein [Salipaludibacillus agaradhaerens]